MKDSEEKDTPQDDIIIIQEQEQKKDPVGQFFTDFFTDMKNGFNTLSEESGEFFLNVKNDASSNWDKFKLSWKNFFDGFKDLSPRHRRFKKLYRKIKAVELKVSEIKDDTTQIKLEISEVATMIEQLMEGHEDLESYMKENLGSDWKVLKNHWKRCKQGDISKWEFAKIGLSKVGKRFAGIFIKV